MTGRVAICGAVVALWASALGRQGFCQEECPYRLTLERISFLDDHPMHENDGAGGWAVGAAIADPVWTRTENPDKPVTYTRNRLVRMQVELTADANPRGIETVLKFTGAGGLSGSQAVVLPPGATAATVTIASTAPLANRVFRYKPSTFDWGYVCAGRDVDPIPGTTNHRIYVILEDPVAGPETELTERRMAWATGAAVEETTAGGAAAKVHADLDGAAIGDAGAKYDESITPRWLLFNGRPGSCIQQAQWMLRILNVLGIAAKTALVYPSHLDGNVLAEEIRHHDADGQNELLAADCGGTLNAFEGVCVQGGVCYAVWPHYARTDYCDVLMAFLEACGPQVWLVWDAPGQGWVIAHPNVPVTCTKPQPCN